MTRSISVTEPTWRYRIMRQILLFLIRIFFRLEVQGMERARMEGPLLVALNHTSLFEAPIVLAIFARQPLTAMAKVEYRGTPIGWVIDAVDPIYVERGEVDRGALREMRRRLQAGAAIGIAPEGTRSEDSTLIEGKEGAAYLALQSDAWIQPVVAWGHENAPRDWLRLHRPVVHIRVGEAFPIRQEEGMSRREAVDAGTRQIMHALARLLPPDRRGVYAAEITGPEEL